MKRYKVYDLYETREVLGYADSIKEVKKLARLRYDDTDGECIICYAELDPVVKKYNFSKRVFLQTC